MDSNVMADGVISLDDRPAIAAINRTNSGLDEHEKKAKTILDRTGKEWTVYGDTVVRVADKSKSSLERLFQSMERLAAVAGKSGADKLIAERDILIRKWGQEEAAIKAITATYERLIAAQEGGESRWSKLGEGIKNGIENPIRAMGGLIEKLGPAGVSIGVVVSTLAAVAVAGIEAARGLAEYGIGIRDVALRTGLTTKEVGQFSFAAKAAGSDVSVFERIMKGLTVAVEDQSSAGEKARGWLLKFGVDLRGVRDGTVSTSEVFQQISEGLEHLPPGFERGAAAMALFKRAGVEAIPTMLELSENLKIAKEQGFGPSEETVTRYTEMNRELSVMDAHFAGIKRMLESKFVMTLELAGSAAKWLLGGGKPDSIKDPWTVAREDQDRAQLYADISNANVAKGKFSAAKTGDAIHDLSVARQLALQDLDPNFANRAPASGTAGSLMLAQAADLKRQIDAIRAGGGSEAMQKRADDRASADLAVVSFQQQQGLTGQLKRAEEALAKMPKPEVGISSMKDVSDYAAAEKTVNGFKNQVDAAKQAAEAIKHVAEQVKEFHRAAGEFEKRGDEAELDAIGKIYYARDLLLKQAQGMKGVEADIAGIRKSADDQAKVIFDKEMEAFEVAAQKSIDSNGAERNRMVQPKDPMKDYLAGFAAQDKIDSINADASKDSLNRDANRALRVSQLAGSTGTDAIQQAYQIRIGLAEDLAAIEAARILKDTTGADQAVQAALAIKAVNKEIAEAQEESMMKVLELQHQQLETLKKDTASLWTTLLTHPAKFGKQLGDTVHAAVVKPIADGMAGMTSRVLQPIIYGADGGGGIAGVFRGAFGGGKQDPMKISTDMNTAVTAQNSAALATLTAIMAGAMGMAAPAVASPAGMGGISLPSISVSAPSIAAPAISAMFRGGGSSAAASMGGFGPAIFGGGSSISGSPDVMGGISGGGAGLFNLPISRQTDSLPLLAALAGGGSPGSSGTPRAASSPLAAMLGMVGAGGGSSDGGGIAGKFAGLRGNLGGFDRANIESTDSHGGETGGQITGVNGLAGAALSGGGMMLAQQGLLGGSRGTFTGVAEGAAGGAAVGMQMGGVMGAAIGLWGGMLIGFGEMLAGVESPETKAKRLVKQIYGISIDSGMAKQIAALAQSKYGGNVTIAVRDPDTRKMLQLYATGTGQKFPLSASTPQAGSLQEQGAVLSQVATYQNGNPYTFQSNLPVAGGLTGGSYASPSAGQSPSSISLTLNGQATTDLLNGRITETVTPGFVQDRYSSSQDASMGRVDAAAMAQYPGLIAS